MFHRFVWFGLSRILSLICNREKIRNQKAQLPALRQVAFCVSYPHLIFQSRTCVSPRLESSIAETLRYTKRPETTWCRSQSSHQEVVRFFVLTVGRYTRNPRRIRPNEFLVGRWNSNHLLRLMINADMNLSGLRSLLIHCCQEIIRFIYSGFFQQNSACRSIHRSSNDTMDKLRQRPQSRKCNGAREKKT